MLSSLKDQNKVVGTRRLLKALEQGKVKTVYLAMDADLYITDQVKGACRNFSVPIVEVPTKKELGEACGVEVKTAAAGVLKVES